MTAYEFILALNGAQWFGIIVLAYIGMWTVVGSFAAIANALRKK